MLSDHDVSGPARPTRGRRWAIHCAGAAGAPRGTGGSGSHKWSDQIRCGPASPPSLSRAGRSRCAGPEKPEPVKALLGRRPCGLGRKYCEIGAMLGHHPCGAATRLRYAALLRPGGPGQQLPRARPLAQSESMAHVPLEAALVGAAITVTAATAGGPETAGRMGVKAWCRLSAASQGSLGRSGGRLAV